MTGLATRVNLAIAATPLPDTTPLRCATCGHLAAYHGVDRRQRPLCRGAVVCGCAAYRKATT